MNVWLITFIVSGSTIILFLVLKIVQERFKILLFWPHARERIEIRLQKRKERLMNSLQTSGNRNISIVSFFIIRKLKRIIAKFYRWLDRRSNRLLSHIRGKQYIDESTKPSHYFKDIGSFRDRFRK